MKLSHGLKRCLSVSAILAFLNVNANQLQAQNSGESSEAGSSILFPSWGVDSLDFSLAPIIGVRSRSTEIQGVDVDTLTTEFGLGVRVRGIPLVKSTFSLTVEPFATATWGSRSQKLKSDTLDRTENSGFDRQWYGVGTKAYYKAFRYSLRIGKGRINYNDRFTDVSAMQVVNDFGLLVLPWLSGHYTITSYRAYEDSYDDPRLLELDNWTHAKLFFDLFSLQLDLGPGVSSVKTYSRDDITNQWSEVGSGNTSYFKALTSLHIIWKLGASGSLKYILKSNEEASLGLLYDQLPNQDLTENSDTNTLPEGSLEASFFFGIRQLIGGFGFGWQYYYLDLNYDDDSDNSNIYRDQGVVVTYDIGL